MNSSLIQESNRKKKDLVWSNFPLNLLKSVKQAKSRTYLYAVKSMQDRQYSYKQIAVQSLAINTQKIK